MNIHIIGIGLIGGSFALDIKSAFTDAKIFGIDANQEHLNKAKSLRLIDCISTIEAIGSADVVIVAIPVDVNIKVVGQVLDKVKDDCLVIDTGSTKSGLCEALGNHPKRRNLLAAHPISGTEFSGPEAAQPDLYRNKTMIIC